jgi:hypothetical protein
MASLAILWRNPKTIKHQVRCRKLTQDPSQKIYVIEELVSPQTDSWVSTAMLEIVHSAPRASGEAKRRKWSFRFGS